MKKIAASILVALLLALSPTVFAEPSEPDLFFTESEAGEIPDIDRTPNPVTWIFVTVGVASVAAVGVLTYLNRRQSINDKKGKTIYKK